MVSILISDFSLGMEGLEACLFFPGPGAAMHGVGVIFKTGARAFEGQGQGADSVGG